MSYMENIWRILKVNKIEADASEVSDFLCVMCKNITIKPHNVPCGCRYCFDCIKDYLNDEEKLCLGESDCCKDILINMRENVFIDQAANRKILKLYVKCPIESCEFRQELSKLEDHLRSCELKPVNCPYRDIGCNKARIGFNQLKDHFTEESFCHARLLMEMVDNFGNEIKLLQAGLQESQHENRSLREDMKLMKQNNEVKEEKIALLKMEIEEQKRKSEKNEARWERWISIFDTGLKQVKASQLAEKSQKNVDSSKRVNEGVKESVPVLVPVLERVPVLLQHNQGYSGFSDFTWRVQGWRDTLVRAVNGTETVIWSDPFLTHRNGYKMCLELHPNGSGDTKGAFLFLGICFMKGEHDDFLVWPFTHDVTLELLNPDTGQAHTSKTVKYSLNGNAWKKPTTARNRSTGFRNFVTLLEVSPIGALCRSDQIWIRASPQIKFPSSCTFVPNEM